MFVAAIFLITIFTLVSFYLTKWIKNYIVLGKLPGPAREGILLGNLSYFRSTPENMFQKLRECGEKFYPVYKIFGVHKISANILSPEDCELILSNPIHNQKGQLYNVLHNWLQNGLLTSYGSKWQARRKILTPAFHFNILQQFILVFNEEAEKLVGILKIETKKESSIEITSHISQFTLKTIIETAMGTKLHFNSQKEIKYKKAVHDVGQISIYRILHPWCIENWANILTSPHHFYELKVIRTLHNFTKELIQTREKAFKDIELPKEGHEVYKGKRRLAMLDLLLSAKNNDHLIDNQGIQEEVDTFTFEGHDTTAVAIGFILMLVAVHEETQDLMLQEMQEVFGDLHKKPTYNDLQNLKYMERVIKESLRLYPSVPLISRTLGEKLKTDSGFVLPKETLTIIHIYDVHRNPEIYPDPEKFDPDRFLPENTQNRHPFAYLPFSAGPRNCIGQRFALLELKATLCAILANFILKPVDTPDTIVLVVDLVLRTKDEIKIKFLSRNQ